MKISIPAMLICALGYGSAAMAECGDDGAASSQDQSTAPAEARIGTPQAKVPQLQEGHSAETNWSTVPFARNLLNTPYEDGGYNP